MYLFLYIHKPSHRNINVHNDYGFMYSSKINKTFICSLPQAPKTKQNPLKPYGFYVKCSKPIRTIICSLPPAPK